MPMAAPFGTGRDWGLGLGRGTNTKKDCWVVVIGHCRGSEQERTDQSGGAVFESQRTVPLGGPALQCMSRALPPTQ